MNSAIIPVRLVSGADGARVQERDWPQVVWRNQRRPADPRGCGPARCLARFRRGRSWPAQPPGLCAGCWERAAAPARPPRVIRTPFATRTGACGSTLGGRARASRNRVGDDVQAPGPAATSCRPPARTRACRWISTWAMRGQWNIRIQPQTRCGISRPNRPLSRQKVNQPQTSGSVALHS
jgi:hypothetical protein